MISAEAAQRIGVTFAPVILAPMSDEIRTVAQVTYDETRVKSISPKIDGWVEQLYVNFTGQAVSVGQPLLTIYSPMLVSAQEELLLASRLRTSLSGASGDTRSGANDLESAARRRLQYWDISRSGDRENRTDRPGAKDVDTSFTGQRCRDREECSRRAEDHERRSAVQSR